MTSKLSYCAIHETFPHNEPCWQCINAYATDASDEQSARLLSALETIARECNCPAHQIAVDTLEMHKAWLTTRKDKA